MYRLEVDPLELGEDVKAIGLELIDEENREPVRGAAAAQVWGRILSALAATEPWGFDFFSHVERVAEYCARHAIPFRHAGARCLVVEPPAEAGLEELLLRFEAETFGVRAGEKLREGDDELEGDLSRRGLDAYHHRYANYFFCAVCDFENGFLTLLTRRLWASEVLRRVQPLLSDLQVNVLIPQ